MLDNILYASKASLAFLALLRELLHFMIGLSWTLKRTNQHLT